MMTLWAHNQLQDCLHGATGSLEQVPGSYQVANKLGGMIFDSSTHYTTHRHCRAWVFTMCHHLPEPHLSIAGRACLASLWSIRRCLLTWNNQCLFCYLMSCIKTAIPTCRSFFSVRIWLWAHVVSWAITVDFSGTTPVDMTCTHT